MSPILVPGQGPRPSQIALVGEAPGLNETIYRKPFIGHSGEELNRMLANAGIERTQCYATNVFKHQPDDNDVGEFFASRTDPDADTSLPPNGKGKYLRRQFRPMVNDLVGELDGVGAKVVVALGATALWALLGYAKISAYVGTVHAPGPGRPFYVIPTYHPSAVLRNWGLRTTVVANLSKVPEYTTKAITRYSSSDPLSRFKIKVNPTLAEIERFVARAILAPLIAIDVETAHGQIRTISFTIEPNSAFVIPFWEPPAPSYWPTIDGEAKAWDAVRRICASPATKVFQLGAYDIQYLWRVHGIPVHGPIEDTGLAHHALEPELPKDLGSLGANYTDLPEWKTMRGNKSEKQED